MFEKCVCPDVNCPSQKWQKEGEMCKLCGTPVKLFSFQDYKKLCDSKKEIQDKVPEIDKASIITDDMTDEDIKKHIINDMHHLAMHESGSGWMRAGTLLSGDRTDIILMDGLKALIDQNKIMIRQNELLLRAILREQKKESHNS